MITILRVFELATKSASKLELHSSWGKKPWRFADSGHTLGLIKAPGLNTATSVSWAVAVVVTELHPFSALKLQLGPLIGSVGLNQQGWDAG